MQVNSLRDALITCQNVLNFLIKLQIQGVIF